ncbi:hypothetical protein EHM76_03565 [bacterium]|nr:MAG: hypothetical protein EHM76_03565 [bacterium]
MNYYTLRYYLIDDYLSKRVQFRDDHLNLALAAQSRGELILAGALTDPVDEALLIFRVENQSTIEEFIKNDPYVINGLVKKWEIRNWTVVIGSK